MSYSLGTRSLARLVGVHPDLSAVVHRAITLTTQDFTVIEGVRSAEQMMVNWGKGRTADEVLRAGLQARYAQPTLAKVTWLAHPLMSNHRVHTDGFGHAVDLGAWVDGAIDWNTSSRYQAIAHAMLTAANELQVPITWGGTWRSPDQPHFELTEETT